MHVARYPTWGTLRQRFLKEKWRMLFVYNHYYYYYYYYYHYYEYN